MAKELPYFQFEPAEYLTKDISFCSLGAQGLFINVCAYYWQRQCDLTKTQFLRRLNYPKEFDELVSEGIIDLENDVINIKFLNAQFDKATKLSITNSSNGSKGGRPKKEKPIETEIKPNENRTKSETISESKGIREDKIIEDEIKQEETKEEKQKIFNFKKSLLNLGAKENLVSDWMAVRKSKKATNTETAFKSFVREFEKTGKHINEILELCIERDWKGFKFEWLKNISSNGNPSQIKTPDHVSNGDGIDWEQEAINRSKFMNQ